MKNRIFLAIFAALGLMACSKSKTSYVGNTYEGKLGEITTLTYQFLSENELKFEINSSWAGHHSYVCRYSNVADRFREDENLSECYKPLLFYMDGCSLLVVDSVNDQSNRKGMLPINEFLPQSGYSDMGDMLSSFLYNDKTNEIITMNEDELEEIMLPFFAAAKESKERTGVASVSTTCRERLVYLSGITCPKKAK